MNFSLASKRQFGKMTKKQNRLKYLKRGQENF
jgi:hypothetical protein